MPCILPMAVKCRVVPVVTVWFGSGDWGGQGDGWQWKVRLMPSPDTFARGVFVDVCEMVIHKRRKKERE
ncbi:hypothetical protein KC332_g38 [Hortaea werneckii]|nr:hypothetical protein KC332_g38 [Hortaea werneckii]KAI7456577.1 hypothetical protein KC368_g71 [Hortaea werneckii]